MNIQFIKLITGENVLAEVEDIDETSDTITLINPILVVVQSVYGTFNYSAYKWNVFTNEKSDCIFLRKNAIMYSGNPNDYIIDMYKKWSSPKEEEEEKEDTKETSDYDYDLSSKSESKEEIDERMEEIMAEFYKKMLSGYPKKVH